MAFKPHKKGKGLAAGDVRSLLESSYQHGEVEGWQKDPELCTDTGCSYVSPDGKVVVAHRGTEGTISDWGNNAAFGIGGEFGYKMTQRYRDANKLQKDTEKKYGRDNVITIGHSQGGLIAELVGGNSKEIITVNKATRPQNIIYGSEKKKNQTDVRTTSDAVSYWSNPFSKKEKAEVTIKSKKTDPLGEHSYDVLSRLGDDTVVGQKDIVFRGKGLFLRRPIYRK